MTRIRAAIEPGSTWVLARGAHSGNVIDVVRVNKTGAVIRNRGGGKAMGNQKVDDTEHRVPLEQFESGRYVPYNGLAAGDTHGARAFRQANPPKPAPVATPPTLPALRPGEMQMQVVDVTPAQAQAWLDNGGPNRAVTEARVNRYAAFMLRGEWRMTAEPIKLDAEARVRDGRHRLLAIIKSGVTVPLVVVRGVDEAAFDVMDSGKNRSPADVLSIHGHTSATGKTAAARALMLIERYGTVVASTMESRTLNTGPTTLAYIDEHPEVEEVYLLAMDLAAVGLQGGPGLWCAVLVLFWRIDPAATREMAAYLKGGAGMPEGHPLLTLRNRALNKEARLYSRSAEGRQEIAGMIIKAWNAWRQGQSLTRLSWKPKEPSLPEIYDGQFVQSALPAEEA